MYKRNVYRHINTNRTFAKQVKKPRRVGFTIATSYLEISDWQALSDIAENIIFDIEIRTGCRKEHIDWHICDAAGEIEITFTPFRTNVELLRSQLQKKYPEYTVTTTYDTASFNATGETTEEVKEDEE